MTSIQTYTPVSELGESSRIEFISKVYQHLAGAVVGFVAVQYLFFQSGIAKGLYEFLFQSGGRWLMFLGLFMIGNWFITSAASDLNNPSRQYVGLIGAVVIEALIFAPFLYLVFHVLDAKSTLAVAAAITLAGFGLLSAIAFITRKDLSFLRPIVFWGFGAAMLAIVGGVIFGFNLGLWFSVAMIGLSGAAILYQTQSIIRHYPSNAYVPAAVSLFGSLMTMFWYVLRLVMQLSRN